MASSWVLAAWTGSGVAALAGWMAHRHLSFTAVAVRRQRVRTLERRLDARSGDAASAQR